MLRLRSLASRVTIGLWSALGGMLLLTWAAYDGLLTRSLFLISWCVAFVSAVWLYRWHGGEWLPLLAGCAMLIALLLWGSRLLTTL